MPSNSKLLTRANCLFEMFFWSRRKSALFILILTGISVYIIGYYYTTSNRDPPYTKSSYFAAYDEYSNRSDGYIVNTSSCRILNIDPWDKSIKHLLEDAKPFTCYKRHKHWTYVQGPSIFINDSAVRESGYSIGAVYCCYKTIQRIAQPSDQYDSHADSRVRLSSTCSPMSKVTRVKRNEEFVKVICYNKYWPYQLSIVYRNFHALVSLDSSSRVAEKINFWKNISKEHRPPNVVIIGIDSMSRLNFHRSFAKTKGTLERLGFVEMVGYTKVGDNTLPNAGPFLTGYSLTELQKMCFFSPETKFDSCPFIWKGFSDAKFLTSLNEDEPRLAIFNYIKTGFVEQPTDFYLRPFMQGVSDSGAYSECIGYDTTHDTVMNYNNELLNLSMSTNTPIFLFSWITVLAHDDLNVPKLGDMTFVNFFDGLEQQGVMENSLVLFMSDHGARFGELRTTFAGWFEEKLPFFWIYVPPSIKKKFPDTDLILQKNSRRITSPYDLYRTLAHVLEMTDNKTNDGFWKDSNGTNRARTFGQSLLSEVPLARTCDVAGIPAGYCACRMPKKLSVSDEFLVKSAISVMSHLNKMLPVQCAPLHLSEITAGAVLLNSGNVDDNRRSFIVTLVTDPGQFLFEANVVYTLVNGSESFYVTGNVLRLSKFTRDASCAKSQFMALYCYCEE